MKKNIFSFVIVFFVSTVCFAQKASICPFSDYFYIKTNATVVISSLTSDGNVASTLIDPLQFKNSCASNTSTSSGHTYVTVREDDENLCTLHILDGPYEMNPSVLFVNCVGRLIFRGMDHAWGTYTYHLKFTDDNTLVN